MSIEAFDLVKTYPPGVHALAGLSLDAPAGRVFGLLGPNGAGKSTTVKILTTLAEPDSGAARVAGHDVRRRPGDVRRAIGVVAQKSGADPMATGRENLLLQGRLYGMSGAALRSRLRDLVDRFGLGETAGRPVRTYSGGTRRRLDVALGLVHRPSVLFLDEPTAGLDPEARSALWTEIARLAAEDGLTVLLTTHYLEEADRLTDRLAIIDAGRVVVTGTAAALKAELRGDAVHVDLREASAESAASAEPAEPAEPTVLSALAAVPAVREPVLDGRSLRARADDGAAAVPAVLAALDRAGVAVAAVTVARPSLDDVYLRHVGRRLEGSAA